MAPRARKDFIIHITPSALHNGALLRSSSAIHTLESAGSADISLRTASYDGYQASAWVPIYSYPMRAGATSVASAIIASAAHAEPASPSIVAAVSTSMTTFMSSRYQMNCLLRRQSSFGQNIVRCVMVPPDVEAILLTELEPVG